MNRSRTDVVVVGGGIIGLCSAWYLCQAGAEVTIVSRPPDEGGDASAGNAGMIVPSHVVPLAAPGAVSQGLRYLMSRSSPFHIKPRFDLDLMRWLWRFWRSCTQANVAAAAPVLRDQSLASVQLFSELQSAIGDFSWDQTGLLMVYRTEKYRGENEWMADLAESLGLRVRRLDGPETFSLEPGVPPETLGSVLYEDDGRVNPSGLLARLRVSLSEAGVVTRDGFSVSSMETAPSGRTRIRSETGETVEAETVVMAAGAWTGQMAAMVGARVPVQPAKGYSLTFPTSPPRLSLPMILSEEKITLTPIPGTTRFAGTLSLAGFDSSTDPLRVEPIRREVRRCLPDLDDSTIENQGVWVGFRPASPDGLPIVGALPGHPGILVATGHGMIGLTLGPVTGRLVADLITGDDPVVDPAPVDPGRF